MQNLSISGRAVVNSADEEAAERNDVLRQLSAAHQELTSQLDTLRRADTSHLHGDAIAHGGARLLQLSALRDQMLAGASGMSAVAIRDSIASALADVRAYATEARSAAAGVQSTPAQAAAIALQQASEAAHSTTVSFMHDYYDQRIFDPYLKFASPSDEEEYRRREDERKKAIDKAQAEHSPEGNLRASQLALEQLKDAGAHGADRSPAYQSWVNKLESSTATLNTRLEQHVAEDSKSARASDPLEKVKPVAAASSDLVASLRAAGVVVADPSGSGHGVTAGASPSASQALR